MQQQPTPDPAPLWSAMLFAATGGLLDAVIYLNHGGVFATAMTGNLILLGIALVSQRGAVALHHCIPIAAYFVGVAISRWARARIPNPSMVALAAEMLCLLLAGFMPPQFPDMLFVGIIAFAAALQVATFRRVGPFFYSSTFVTGDLLDLSEATCDTLLVRSPEKRRSAALKARDLGLICVAFLGGAVAGAGAAPQLHNRSFWLPEPLLAIILGAMVSRLNRNRPGTVPRPAADRSSR